MSLKYLIPVILASLITLPAMADDSSSGCGLGWMVFKKNSLVSSALRATTNAIALNTVAMTSGTSGCAQHSIVKNESRGIHFTEANFEQLKMELAQGQGEFSQGLALVMGCEGQTERFQNVMQNQYSEINAGTPVQFYQNVKKEIGRDNLLAQGCHTI